MYEIILFYKYVHIENPNAFMKEQREIQERLSLKGRTLIAHEGINATLEGTPEHIQAYVQELLKDPRFTGTHIKKSVGNGNAFPKCDIKVRDEIVASRLGACDIDPNIVTGKRLSPELLHKWIHEKKDFYIVDMRNAYEYNVGYFEESIKPSMENFRDLPKFVKSLKHLINKTVVTVCTGGVRCEKASGYLVQKGFADVWQLDGGIVSYMEKYPNENFLGKLYVFDSRISMGFYTDDPKHTVVGKCVVCEKPCERFTNCARIECHRQLIACAGCEEKKGTGFICRQGCKPNYRNKKNILVSCWRQVIRTLNNHVTY